MTKQVHRIYCLYHHELCVWFEGGQSLWKERIVFICSNLGSCFVRLRKFVKLLGICFSESQYPDVSPH